FGGVRSTGRRPGGRSSTSMHRRALRTSGGGSAAKTAERALDQHVRGAQVAADVEQLVELGGRELCPIVRRELVAQRRPGARRPGGRRGGRRGPRRRCGGAGGG